MADAKVRTKPMVGDTFKDGDRLMVIVRVGVGSTATCSQRFAKGSYGKLEQSSWAYGSDHSWDAVLPGESNLPKRKFRSSFYAPKREYVTREEKNDDE